MKVRVENNAVHIRANRVQRLRVRLHEGKACINIRESAIQSDEETPTRASISPPPPPVMIVYPARPSAAATALVRR